MRFMILMCFLVAACGDPIDPDLYLDRCEDTGFQGVFGEQDRGTLDCDNFRIFATLSRKLMIASGLATEDQITSLREHTVVLVRSTHAWIDPLTQILVMGHNDGYGNIMVGNLSILWHEEFHSVQASDCDWTTGMHEGWKVDGYYGLDNYFRFHTFQYREDPNPSKYGGVACKLGTLKPEMVDQLRGGDNPFNNDVDSFMETCP